MKKYIVILSIVLIFGNACVNAQNLSQQLWNVTKNGTLKEMKDLLDKGADPNTHGESFGANCLMVASYNGQLDKVKLLLNYGADINGVHNGKGLVGSKGENALSYCILGYNENNKTENVALFLINKNIDINYANKFGFNLLMYSSREGLPKLTQMLIDKGLGVNEKTTDNHTALSIACLKCQTEIVKILLKNGAKTDIKINSGEFKGLTALDIAKKKNCSEIVEILI